MCHLCYMFYGSHWLSVSAKVERSDVHECVRNNQSTQCVRLVSAMQSLMTGLLFTGARKSQMKPTIVLRFP